MNEMKTQRITAADPDQFLVPGDSEMLSDL